MVRTVLGLGAAALFTGVAAGQINVVNNNSPVALSNALAPLGGGINITSMSVFGHSLGSGEMSTGIYNVAGPNNYGLVGGGIVLSSGNAAAYSSGPNTSSGFTTNYGNPGGGGAGVPATPAQDAALSTISGFPTHYDVTEINISFTADPGVNTVGFNVIFGSDEYQEYQGSQFIDAFGVFLNGSNVAFYNSLPININHPNMMDVPETELDGILRSNNAVPYFQVIVPLNPNISTHSLTFMLGDTSDGVLDTTVYLSSLAIPAPAAACPLAMGAMFAMRRRR